jgi:hypothetical protein
MLSKPQAFCTLFDSGYLSRGLAMIESLQKYEPNAKVYVFAFDSTAESILLKLNLPSVTVIGLRDFEDPELLKIKASRTRGEYCWTSTPSTILYCLRKFNLDACTYVDADLYFWSSPEALFEEMGTASVLITPHWYTPRYDQTKDSGIYCVQFVTIRNTKAGLQALNWWRDRCLEWCYARAEDGKFGDQKYLDDWTTRFEGVHVVENRGGGMAPWNVQQYEPVTREQWRIKKTGTLFKPVFFHFHALRRTGETTFFRGDYFLQDSVVETLYQPYTEKLVRLETKLFTDFALAMTIRPLPEATLLKRFKNKIKALIEPFR